MSPVRKRASLKAGSAGVALSLALAPAPAYAVAPDFAPLELGSLSSAAGLEDASALAVNTAALAFQRSSELYFGRSLNGLDQTSLFLTGGGGGFAWQQFRTSDNRFLNAYRFGGSFEAIGGLAFGGSFNYLQFLDGQGGNSPDFGLSALYRPNSWVAAGLAVHHLNQPAVEAAVGTTGASVLRRQYRPGIAIRPGTERITLSLDGAWNEGDRIDAVVPWAGVQLEPIPGLTVRGIVNQKLDYSLGLGLQFGQVGTGFMTGVTGPRFAGSDMAYVTTSDLENRRAMRIGASRMAYMRLEGDLLDIPQSIFELRQDYYPGVLHLTRRIAEAKADPKVTGLVLDLRGVSAGLGKIQELRDAVADFKTAGKPAIAFVTDPAMGEYYLAVAADKIYQHPAGSLDLKGLSMTTPFFKGFFDKIGVQPQFVGIGKYKSAPEQFMRKDLSDPAREQEEALLTDAYDMIVDAIAKARRLSKDEVKAIVARGMITPPVAKEKRLVDDVVYPDQVPGLVEKGSANTYHLAEYKPDTWALPDKLAVVVIDGSITRGESDGGNLIDGSNSGSATVTRALRALRKDDAVKAIVIRVDSPGGDAVASDEIGREIDLIRLENKPVIISMGDVAASGGYWVAANGTRIYAEPGTITGSIGVFSGHFAFRGLIDKLGITTETIKRGEHADMDGGARPWTEAEQAMIRDHARYTYVQFLDRVAKGRRMATSRVDELAQGRVWSGVRALDNGLIDKFGGLEAAIADARQMGELDPTRSVVEFWPKPGSLWETFDDSNMDAQLRRTANAVKRYSRVNTWLIAPQAEPTSD